jgi:Ca2+-binding RTX toxin-like protein
MLTTIKSWLGETKSTPKPRRTMLDVEALGDRTLMSATLTNGTLFVDGTANHDTVVVSRQYFEGQWWVRVNERVSDGTFLYAPKDSWFRQADVRSISFSGGNGHDSFTNNTHLPSTAYGGAGNDTLRGGSGVDKFYGNAGHDLLFGNGGNDHLYGDAGNDVIQGGAGIDRLYGGADNDKLFGGSSYDYLYGGGGDDFLDDGGGLNFVDGGPGLDFNARVIALRGATKEDVVQDQSPSCGCLAAIQSVAHTGRNLASQITYLGVGNTGTNPVYRVRLWMNGAWRNYDVPFNGDLITRTLSNGTVETYDAVPKSDHVSTNRGCEQQSWVTILQRAYYQAKGVNWRSWQAVKDDGRCNPGDVMFSLTGRASKQYDAGWFDSTLDREDRIRIMNALAANKAVVVGTFNSNSDLSTRQLIAKHAYSVVGCYTRSDGMTMFKLRNPWGFDGGRDSSNNQIDGLDSNHYDATFDVTWTDFMKSVEDYWVN